MYPLSEAREINMLDYVHQKLSFINVLKKKKGRQISTEYKESLRLVTFS
jgi:hypothetical protein